MGKAYAIPPAPRQGRNGRLDEACLPCSISQGHSPLLWIKNEVSPGMWSGGIVGIKSILGIKKKSDALLMLDKLSELGYIKKERRFIHSRY